jgi:hypothetical protein
LRRTPPHGSDPARRDNPAMQVRPENIMRIAMRATLHGKELKPGARVGKVPFPLFPRLYVQPRC